jgi:hypothetical protein
MTINKTGLIEDWYKQRRMKTGAIDTETKLGVKVAVFSRLVVVASGQVLHLEGIHATVLFV